MGKEVYSAALDLLLQVGQYNFIELFTLYLRNAVVNNAEYIELMSEFMSQIIESESVLGEIANSGVIAYWVELGLSEADVGNGKINDNRISSLSFLLKIITTFFSTIEESETLMNLIMSLLNRTCRDASDILKYVSIGILFYLLEFFAERKSSYAPIIYRTLTFLLVETYTSSYMREYMSQNFTILFKNNSTIPIGILIEPYLKRLQVSDVSLEVFDYDFLSVLSDYPLISLKQAIQLIDIVGKCYLSELVYSKVSGVPFTQLASRFIQQQAMQDYLYVFTQYSLGLVIATEQGKIKKNTNKKKKIENIEEKLQQRNRILDMIS